ncbi:MAG: transglutaminase-like cysteine peptidase [Pseudolabrys sp.]|nr:transglutaminase-like cysteine peptidase [Pseudolabrys sp.]
MVTLAEGRGIAMSLALLAGLLPADLWERASPEPLAAPRLAVPAASEERSVAFAADVMPASAPPRAEAEAVAPSLRGAATERATAAGADRTARDLGERIALAEIGMPPRVQSVAPPPQPPHSPLPARRGPARFFTINEVLAGARAGAARPPGLRLAAVEPTTRDIDAGAPGSPMSRGGEPFGLFAFKAPEGPLWVKWRAVEAQLDAEAPALARCRADHGRCSAGETRFLDIVAQAATLAGRARIEFVNRRINAAIRYIADVAQWGVPDRWSAPVDAEGKGSLDTGLGDCEDYAIAKYATLVAAGTPARDLRVLLVHDHVAGLDHAVLAVRSDGRWLILDNRTSMLLEERDARSLAPLFALDAEGVKLFAAPYAGSPDQEGATGLGAGSSGADAPGDVAAGRGSLLPLAL